MKYAFILKNNPAYLYKMKKTIIVFTLLIYSSLLFAQTLTETEAIRLARLPLRCIITEFPNKTSHTADGPEDAALLPEQCILLFTDALTGTVVCMGIGCW